MTLIWAKKEKLENRVELYLVTWHNGYLKPLYCVFCHLTRRLNCLEVRIIREGLCLCLPGVMNEWGLSDLPRAPLRSSLSLLVSPCLAAQPDLAPETLTDDLWPDMLRGEYLRKIWASWSKNRKYWHYDFSLNRNLYCNQTAFDNVKELGLTISIIHDSHI